LNPLFFVVHCSGGTTGDAAFIDRLHKGNGWSGNGYHAVILNGYRNWQSLYQSILDGKIEPGRSKSRVGAHTGAQSMNVRSWGVCLIGHPDQPRMGALGRGDARVVRPYVTERQWQALVHLLATWCIEAGRDPMGSAKHPSTGRTVPTITQHSDHEPKKPLCASLNIPLLRRHVADEVARRKNRS
jgi:hypothetical protein